MLRSTRGDSERGRAYCDTGSAGVDPGFFGGGPQVSKGAAAGQGAAPCVGAPSLADQKIRFLG